MKDPLAWLAYSALVVQGIFALALLFTGWRLSQWTKETRRERIASDRLARSNQNIVDFLARTTGTKPFPLASDDETMIA